MVEQLMGDWTETMATAVGQVVTVTDDTFGERVMAADLPVLVEFGAPWCEPCRALGPILAQVSEDLRGALVVAMIDTDAQPRGTAELGIMGVPTLVLFKGGVAVERIVGYHPKA